MSNDTAQAKKRGFAALSPERRREIASRGGRAVHEAGTAHRFTSAEARAAGSKGGKAPHVTRGRQRLKVAEEPLTREDAPAVEG